MKAPRRLGFANASAGEERESDPPRVDVRPYVPAIKAGARALRTVQKQAEKALRMTEAHLCGDDAEALERLADVLVQGGKL